MDAESRKSLRHGFILREADLRRLVDTIEDQFQKILPGPKTTQRFRLKFRNGVIAETDSIDEVLGEENSGSGQIIRLLYDRRTDEAVKPTHVSFELINVDSDDEPGYVSARFSVFGHDRDWVFVTSSLLEERIDRIKRFAPNQLGETPPSKSLFRLAGVLLPLGAVLAVLLALQYTVSKQVKPEDIATRLESLWKGGQIKEPIDAMIFLERKRAADRPHLDLFPTRIAVYIILGFAALFGTFFFFLKYYPVYNFCWGEYLDEFKRREAARKFWLVVIVVGVVVSFVGSMLANRLSLLR